MGIQINGNTDTITAIDGSLTVSGAELPTVTNLNATGIVTSTTLSVTNIKHPSFGSNIFVFDSSGNININSGGVYYDASNNRLAIGTTSPAHSLDVAGSIIRVGTSTSDGSLLFGTSATTAPRIGLASSTEFRAAWARDANTFLTFLTNDLERCRVTADGKLLVGTSSARGNVYGSFSPYLQLEGGSVNGQDMLLITRNQNDIYGPHLILAKSRGTANTIVASGDLLGTVSMVGNDGSSFIQAARIEAFVDGTPGANDMPGRLVFSTTADGASSPTERMRIGAGGSILLGSTSSAGHSGVGITKTLQIGSNTSIDLPVCIGGGYTGDASLNVRDFNGIAASFFYGASKVGSITCTPSNTAYNTSSDYRLKENVAPLTGAIDRVNQLQVHRFNFIADPDKTVDGFIAHEAQAVVPECVTGEKDAVDDEGNPVYQGIDQSKLVPLLTAALQEALHKIETQAGVITALDARLKVLEAQ